MTLIVIASIAILIFAATAGYCIRRYATQQQRSQAFMDEIEADIDREFGRYICDRIETGAIYASHVDYPQR